MFASAALLLSCETKTSQDGQTATTTENADNPPAQADSSAVGTKQESAPVANNAGARPALNPPHGEPYHRCDIEVGAPLDNPAPVQNVAPQAVQPAPQGGFNTNPISPSLQAPAVSSSPASGSKPALNPPHGEPHHRCDLQVGAPLT